MLMSPMHETMSFIHSLAFSCCVQRDGQILPARSWHCGPLSGSGLVWHSTRLTRGQGAGRYVWALVHSRDDRDVKLGLQLAEKMVDSGDVRHPHKLSARSETNLQGYAAATAVCDSTRCRHAHSPRQLPLRPWLFMRQTFFDCVLPTGYLQPLIAHCTGSARCMLHHPLQVCDAAVRRSRSSGFGTSSTSVR